jgi:DNA invertase Pin-like site-specific DNA recombinase
MSSQTFDSTYRLRMPELEGAIIREIQHGFSLRRVADILGINRKTVSRRLDRARHQDIRWVSQSSGRSQGPRRAVGPGGPTTLLARQRD